MLRASGVPLAEIKKRGRWVTDQSLRRYEKATAAQALANKIPNNILEYGWQIKQVLPTLAALLSKYVTHYKSEPAAAQSFLALLVRQLPPRPAVQSRAAISSPPQMSTYL